MLHVSGQGEYSIKTSSITPISPDQCFQKYRELKSIMETERSQGSVLKAILLACMSQISWRGYRFKLFVPKETCSIDFSLSGVGCTGRDEPYSNDAIYLMKRKIMQRDVELLHAYLWMALEGEITQYQASGHE
ncbi:staphylococcal nuclease domain-containing protein 1-like protein, partial [Tanacetum coccineum]